MKRLLIVLMAASFLGCSSSTDVIENTYSKVIDFWADIVEVECECYYDEAGYEDEAACLEDNEITSQNRSDFLSCVRDSIDEMETSPPDEAVDFYRCITDVYDDVDDCFDDIDCSEESLDAAEDCLDDLEGEFEDCEELLTDEADDWVDSLDRKVDENDCFDIIELF